VDVVEVGTEPTFLRGGSAVEHAPAANVAEVAAASLSA
jgi:hypothetical protein